jgi:hypothetical protein
MQPQQHQQNYNTKEMLQGACNCAKTKKKKTKSAPKNFA